jgi:hypothetical protein
MYSIKKTKEGWIVLSPEGKRALVPQASKQDAAEVASWFNSIKKEK